MAEHARSGNGENKEADLEKSLLLFAAKDPDFLKLVDAPGLPQNQLLAVMVKTYRANLFTPKDSVADVAQAVSGKAHGVVRVPTTPVQTYEERLSIAAAQEALITAVRNHKRDGALLRDGKASQTLVNLVNAVDGSFLISRLACNIIHVDPLTKLQTDLNPLGNQIGNQLPDAIFWLFARHKSSGLRKQVAEYIGVSDCILEALSGDPDAEVRRIAEARLADCAGGGVMAAAWSTDVKTRGDLADKKLPEAAYMILARDPIDFIRATLARNENASVAALEVLSKDLSEDPLIPYCHGQNYPGPSIGSAAYSTLSILRSRK